MAAERQAQILGGGDTWRLVEDDPRLLDPQLIGLRQPFEVNFRQACDLHDAGYSGAKVKDPLHGAKVVDFFPWNQHSLDVKFAGDLELLCQRQIPPQRPGLLAPCRSRADAMVALVTTLGHRWYVPRPKLDGPWVVKGQPEKHGWQITYLERSVRAVSLQNPRAPLSAPRYHFRGTLISRDQDSIVDGVTLTSRQSAPTRLLVTKSGDLVIRGPGTRLVRAGTLNIRIGGLPPGVKANVRVEQVRDSGTRLRLTKGGLLLVEAGRPYLITAIPVRGPAGAGGRLVKYLTSPLEQNATVRHGRVHVVSVAYLRRAPIPPPPPGTGSSPVRSGGCSKATADRIVSQMYPADDRFPADGQRPPVVQVLCGAFLGPGSQAMVFSIPSAGSATSFEWVVFSLKGGEWQRVMWRQNGAHLAAVGSDIHEMIFILRPGDPRSSPTGGTRSRTWRWDGARLVPGPWTQVTPGKKAAPPAGSGALAHFKTPSGNIVCLAHRSSVLCGIHSGLRPPPARRTCTIGSPNLVFIQLPATGRASVSFCMGDPGPFVGEEDARVLGYGKRLSRGGMICRSEVAGVTCRNPTGRGFFLSRDRYRLF